MYGCTPKGGGSGYGIYLSSSSDNVLVNNVANSNIGEKWCPSPGNGFGICLSSSLNNTLVNNTANSNTGKGTGYGIHLSSSSNNTLNSNTIDSNSHYGIHLSSSSNNSLIGNTASLNSNNGIYLSSSSDDNTITYNNASDLGIDSSNNNLIYRSNLFGKATDNFGRNAWDNGKDGNYWDDYSGKDANSDGIGDTPYTNINTNSFATDRFPLMNPVKKPADTQTPGIIEGIKEKLFPSKEPKVTPAPAPTQTTPIMPSPTQLPEEQTPAPPSSTSQPPRGIFVPLWLLLTLGGAILVAALLIFGKPIMLRYYRRKMKKWEKEGYDVSKMKEVLGDGK